MKMLVPTRTELAEIIFDAKPLFENESNYITLKNDKPMVFVGDTHGDFETTEEIINRFFGTHRLVFLGDYVNRAPEELGSIKNITYLLKLKADDPENIVLLRGNHEFADNFMRHGFASELLEATLQNFMESFEEVFSQMPYVVVTENGLVGLHGGLPNISSIDELEDLPKGVTDCDDNSIISQIVWNDHVSYDFGTRGFDINLRRRFFDEKGLIYSESYFNEKMRILGKSVLVRGHDYDAKGFDFNDRLLTIFSSRRYANEGPFKGVYVAVMDHPEKEIKTARDLRIEHLC